MSHDLLVGCRHETQAAVKLNWFTTSLLLLVAFSSPGAFRLLLQEIRRRMRVRNMGLERLLKDIKIAFPSFYGVTHAETTFIMSTVATIWRNHFLDGGSNPFTETRDDLHAEGLPVAWFRRTLF